MKFLEFIHDPISGFFTVLGAVLLSMFGAFIKDGILKLFSHSSKRLKEKREKDIKERDEIVEQLVNSQPYLILYCVKTILSNITVVLIYLVLIAVPTYIKISTPNGILFPAKESSLALPDWSVSGKTFVQIFILLLLLLSSITGLVIIYSVSKRNLIIALATKMIQATFKEGDAKEVVNTANPAVTVSTTDNALTLTQSAKETHGDAKSQHEKCNVFFTKRIHRNGKVYVARNGVLYVVKPGKDTDEK